MFRADKASIETKIQTFCNTKTCFERLH